MIAIHRLAVSQGVNLIAATFNPRKETSHDNRYYRQEFAACVASPPVR